MAMWRRSGGATEPTRTTLRNAAKISDQVRSMRRSWWLHIRSFGFTKGAASFAARIGFTGQFRRERQMTSDIECSILNLLASADEPLTTAQILDKLHLRPVVRDIYSILLLMQSCGLVECTASCPWLWAPAKGVGSSKIEGGSPGPVRSFRYEL